MNALETKEAELEAIDDQIAAVLAADPFTTEHQVKHDKLQKLRAAKVKEINELQSKGPGRKSHPDQPTRNGSYSNTHKGPLNINGKVIPATGPQHKSTWIDRHTGRPISVLSANERFTDLAAAKYEGDADELSVGRMIRAMAIGDWRGAELERNCLSNSGASSGGGSHLVPDILSSQFIDLARSKSVMIRAGVPSVDMESENLSIAKCDTDATFSVKAENSAWSEDSTLAFGRATLIARTIGAVVRSSMELAQDAPNFPQIIEQVLGNGLGVKIDQLALRGQPSDGVTGVIYTSGVNSVSSIGAILWEDFHNAAIAVRENNFEPNMIAVHPTILGDAQILTSGDGTNSAKLWLGPPPSVANIPMYDTTGLTTALGVVGDTRYGLFGFRQTARVETSNDADDSFHKFSLMIRITMRLDFIVTRPLAWTAMTGITT